LHDAGDGEAAGTDRDELEMLAVRCAIGNINCKGAYHAGSCGLARELLRHKAVDECR
jgi:hypothetical protein